MIVDDVLRSPDPTNRPNSMVSTTGDVRFIADWEMDQMLAKGWRRITNPRASYLPQYDQNFNHAVPPGGELVENIEITDVLEVEEV